MLSQSNLPNITPTITLSREDAISLIISSIAMEELGLSHILNAEGEKLQYVLGTLPGKSLPAPPTLSELLAVNNSIRKTLKETTRKDRVLSNKLETALCASKEPIGPTGTTGPTGPTGITGPTGTTCVPCWPVVFIYEGNPRTHLACVPVIEGPTPCVSIETPTGATCVPLPTTCVLFSTPMGITCVDNFSIDSPLPPCATVPLGPTGPIIGPTTGPGPV